MIGIFFEIKFTIFRSCHRREQCLIRMNESSLRNQKEKHRKKIHRQLKIEHQKQKCKIRKTKPVELF